MDYGKQGVVLDDSDDDTGGYYGNYKEYGYKAHDDECSLNDSDHNDVSHSYDDDELSSTVDNLTI